MYSLDPDACRIARDAFERAEAELPTTLRTPEEKSRLASRVLSLVAVGERDVDRIRDIVLAGRHRDASGAKTVIADDDPQTNGPDIIDPGRLESPMLSPNVISSARRTG